MMEEYNLELYVKILIASIGAIVAFRNLKDSFTSLNRKQELKIDLEILEKLESVSQVDYLRVKYRVTKNIKKTFYRQPNSIISNFLFGTFMFLGFGFWTYDLYSKSVDFNGWILLTLFFSIMGLVTIFIDSDDENDEKINPFYKVGIYNIKGFRSGVICLLVGLITTLILLLKVEKGSYWILVSGFLFLIGFKLIFENIRRIDSGED